MATALQQQLAQIAANSTHQLDLKAQKARHSKSLLFEPRDAAGQSFETIYQICCEGFEELCMLDARFGAYSRNIFSEQSRDEDRTQMTAKENEELDKTLESFLGLVGGRLLLKPAMKAVEWLVRRFRVQEYNAEATLLTFLPYHTSHIFPTLLSIMPDQLPPAFRFLQPYKASLQSPPRHAVLTAAITNYGFFSAFSQYALRVAKARQHSAILLGFWASITAQAVNGMIDTTRSGRDNVRRQREEDLLLRVLPVLQSALSIKGVPELYLGASMVMTILATKASLDDRVLDAMMEAIVTAWTQQTVEDGLTCLAVLAEEKSEAAVPKVVAKAVQGADGSMRMLADLSERHRTDKLVIGLARSGVDSESSPELLGLLQQLATRKDVDMADLLPQLALQSADDQLIDGTALNEEAKDIDEEPGQAAQDELEVRLTGLSKLSAKHPSLLDSHNNELFRDYLVLFHWAAQSDERLEMLFEKLPFKRENWTMDCTFLSFLARVWTTCQHVLARAKALESAAALIKTKVAETNIDMQMLLPYLIAALTDPSQRVRRAAAVSIKDIEGLYSETAKTAVVWAEKTICGTRTKEVHALTSQNAQAFVQLALLPILEDCVLDADFAVRAIADALKGSDGAIGKETKGLKGSIRAEACTWLASHICATPAPRVQLRLLEVINRSGKAASDARRKLLAPFAKDWASTPTVGNEYKEKDLDRAVLGALTHRSPDELTTLQDIAAGSSTVEELRSIAFERLRHIYPVLKEQAQISTADWLLDLALSDNEHVSADALETLRNLDYTTEVLVHLVHALPNASDLQDQPSSAKKRRTSKSDPPHPRPLDTAAVQAALKRVTLVLELVEGAKPEKRPQLLKGLFHLLSELHHYKTMLGSQLVYVQGLLLNCLLAVVDGLKANPSTAEIDRTVIRADLIVETVRMTSSTQVHNTALLVISGLATWAPELVLHSVMPLFTFMSTTLLRQSDEYSAHVTDQTVARIVPPLAASLKRRGKDLASGASELLLSFTAAFEHIPLHRRADLFQHLVQTLGPEESLFAVVAMLVERYSTDDRLQPFVGELMNHFAVATQMRALQQYLDLIFDALKPKRTLSNVILGLGEKDAAEVEDSIDNLLQAFAGLLSNKFLRKRIAQEFDLPFEAAALRSIYSRLLEQTMLLNRQVSTNEDLARTTANVLSALLGLTPTKDFIESSAQLMQIGSNETRQQVFRALEARVVQAKRGDASLQQTFLEVLPNCCVFIAPEQPVAVRHAAINCLDQIVEKYGKRDRGAVLDAAKTITGPAALGSDDISLRVGSAFCLASMVEVLGDEFIPILPSTILTALEYLQAAVTQPSQTPRLVVALFALLTTVLDHLPYMYSSEYLQPSLVLAGRIAEGVQASANDLAAVSRFCTLAADKAAVEIVLSSIDSTFTEVTALGPAAATQHLDTFRRALKLQGKASLATLQPAISNVLLQAFDFRRVHTAGGEGQDDYAAVFELVNEVAMGLVLKLDDKTFRPFFAKFVEWATSGLPKRDVAGLVLRATSLFRFTHLFFEQLKSVITGYSSYIMEPAAGWLSSLALTTDADRVLLSAVLQTLSSSFRHDQDGFWQSPDHFDAIIEPLMAQISKAHTISVIEDIIPAIAELASAVSASNEQLKSINSFLLRYMRHEDAAVRLAAVKAERTLTDKLGLDWMTLLPEILPFIAELQEDDDRAVEIETLRWRPQIEAITGEGIESMLA